MKVTLLSYEDNLGGAGRAAVKLHRALTQHGVESRLRVATKVSDLPDVETHRTLYQKVVTRVAERLRPKVVALQRSPGHGPRSPGWSSPGIVPELNSSDADVLHLNWICGLLSVEDIGRLEKPIVWRLSDMWAFSGIEHYGDDGVQARWRAGYTRENRPRSHKGLDLDRWAWSRKRRAWRTPIQVVTPSRWLADCVKESALMREWPITVIPTVLDVRQFQPWPKAFAREVLGLPHEGRVILFGALGGGTDPRKGRKFLEAALTACAPRLEDATAVIFGQAEPADPPRLGLPMRWLGHLGDDATLSLVYSAADVMVIPSLQDNLPQTGVEAQSCGCPVVAFDCSGLPDLLEHGVTGYLARPFDTDDLARGIEWVLGDAGRHASLARQARERAVRLWSPAVVVPQYLDIYERAIQARKSA